MEDSQIVSLYWQRLEQAIYETDQKYGSYCRSIAGNILRSQEDAQECVNDTYLACWNSIPPHRPSVLATFLGKITRRISIDRWRMENAEKRGGGEVTLALDELSECVSGKQDTESEVQQKELIAAIHRFLDHLPETERRIFLLRYWYLEAIPVISARYGFSRSKTASILHRTRTKLRRLLEKEGYL